jgi:hypothetical protein
MRRTPQIAALALAAATVLPQVATAAQTPAELLAAAAPVSGSPVSSDAPRLTDTPIASRDLTLLADAGDAEQLLAQAPRATATPPVTSLPRTGPQLLLTLLAGGGFLLAGGGLRLRLRAGEPGAPRFAGVDGAQPDTMPFAVPLPAVDGPR